MVNNLACEDCRFLVKCSAYAKLKPFLEDARRDLGVTLLVMITSLLTMKMTMTMKMKTKKI